MEHQAIMKRIYHLVRRKPFGGGAIELEMVLNEQAPEPLECKLVFNYL